MLRRAEEPCVSLSNPKHVEYEVVRTSLLPGALKTAQFNRAMPVSPYNMHHGGGHSILLCLV